MIQQLLNLTNEAYANYRYGYYIDYCVNLSNKSTFQIEELVKNEKLQTYFNTQWLVKVEYGIINEYAGYLNVMTPEILIDCIDIEYKTLEQHYPAPILKQIQKAKQNENEHRTQRDTGI